LEVIHKIMGGRVQVYKRADFGRYWWARTRVNNQKHRVSTGEESLSHAKQIAEDWYLELRGKSRAGLLTTEKTFAETAKQFTAEYGLITEGQRSPKWVEGHQIRLRLHLLPFFGELGISEVTAGKVQEYRVHRAKTGRKGKAAAQGEDPPPAKAPARSTLHDEVGTLRLVLKTAIRHGWLDHLPDLSPPYRTQGKVTHRPWFSPAEYKQLYEATREYAENPSHENHRWEAEQLHDFVLFMANTGLRPDEAKNLQHRDVSVVKDADLGQTILEIEVRGKRGVGYCKSMPGAVRPYQRLLKRARVIGPSQTKRARRQRGEDPNTPVPENQVRLPGRTDPVFPGEHKKIFNNLLERTKLKLDRDGNPRTAYSLRHTYICMRLMEGADIYQIAKNCRTSVEMIERFYAAHIKSTLDASAINVLKPKRAAKAKRDPERPTTDKPGKPARASRRRKRDV
jgi:integrase